MAQEAKVPATQPEERNSVPMTQMVQSEKWLQKIFLWPPVWPQHTPQTHRGLDFQPAMNNETISGQAE